MALGYSSHHTYEFHPVATGLVRSIPMEMALNGRSVRIFTKWLGEAGQAQSEQKLICYPTLTIFWRSTIIFLVESLIYLHKILQPDLFHCRDTLTFTQNTAHCSTLAATVISRVLGTQIMVCKVCLAHEQYLGRAVASYSDYNMYIVPMCRCPLRLLSRTMCP